MLSSENKLPLYLQLVKTLKKQIKENMKENDKIPSEKEICDMYSVSRTTVRLAMAELEKDGFIYRLQGKGSFVSDLKKVSSNSFIEVDERNILEKLYYNLYEYILIMFGMTSIFDKDITSLAEEMKALLMQYLVIINDKKSILVDYYFLDNKFNSIDKSSLEVNSIDDLLDKMEIKINRVEENYIIESASQELSNKLDIEINHPLLCVKKSFMIQITKLYLFL